MMGQSFLHRLAANFKAAQTQKETALYDPVVQQGIGILDPGGSMIDVTQAAESTYGRPVAEMSEAQIQLFAKIAAEKLNAQLGGGYAAPDGAPLQAGISGGGGGALLVFVAVGAGLLLFSGRGRK